jgi:hypothetical protein
MTIEHNDDLVKEWQQLHNSYEKYEHFALVIKLVAIALTLFLIVLIQPMTISLLMLAILWLQEGIWKTYQARINDRVELIEIALLDIKLEDKNFADKKDTIAFQFYNQWSEKRAGSAALIKEYIKNSIKPTVVYPYVPLMIIVSIA